MGANRGQHWSDTEIAALLDVWGDDKIQTQLNGAYRNDSVFQKIAAALATRGFKLSGKQCRDQLESSVVFLLAARKKGVAVGAI